MNTKRAKHNHILAQLMCCADILAEGKQQCERELEARRGDFETSAAVSPVAWLISTRRKTHEYKA